MASRGGREIETERLLLRPPSNSDLDDWAHLIFADPTVMRFEPQRDIEPRERAERALAGYSRLWKEHEVAGWVVFDKETLEFIGHCEIQEEFGEPELGFALGRRHWGKGIATEVVRAAIRYGFEIAKLDRIRAVVDPDNIAARKLLAKTGFKAKKEAMRDDMQVVFYSIARADFEPDDSLHQVSPSSADSDQAAHIGTYRAV